MAHQKAKDHLGNEYPSTNAMCTAYNIGISSFKYRMNILKWSLEKTLTTPKQDMLRTTAIECTDHLGNTFESKRAMCDHWRIPRPIFFRRMRAGWDLEKALTTETKPTVKIKMISDPEGNQFKTLDAMCAYYNISKEQYMINIRNNMSIKNALISTSERPKHPKDHLGNEYRSTNEMCKHYNITKTTLRSRLELGWTLEDILTHPESHTVKFKVTDHEGRKFDTQKDMLEYHNVNYTIFKDRQKKGRTLDEMLSSESLHYVKSTDHHGQEFDCIQDMLHWWNAKPGGYHHHKNRQKNSENKLLGFYITKPEIDEHLKINKKYGRFYAVTYKKRDQMWSDLILYNYIRRITVIKYLDENNNKLPQNVEVERKNDNCFKLKFDNFEVMLTSDMLFKIIYFSKYKLLNRDKLQKLFQK